MIRLFVLLALTWAAGLRGEITRDIEYGRAGGEVLLLDASVPEGPGLFPIAILVHGGGWRGGDKSGSARPGDGTDITPWFGLLTTAKFTWFSVNYRLTPHTWPASFEDVQTAIRWVKKHAGEFKGDPQRIVLFGHSAGGQLVCLAATTANEETKVQAVVACAALTDFDEYLRGRTELSPGLQTLFQRPKAVDAETLHVLGQASPIAFVREGLPPFLLVHGEADKTVPVQQAWGFQARLKEKGVRADLILIPGGPHTMTTWEKFAPDYPSQVRAWLQTNLAR